MNIRYFIILGFIILTSGSCNSFLIPSRRMRFFPAITTKRRRSSIYALTSVYHTLGTDGLYGNNVLYLLGWSADEGFMNRSSIATGAFRLNHTTGDSYVTAFWRELYNGINRANNLLEERGQQPVHRRGQTPHGAWRSTFPPGVLLFPARAELRRCAAEAGIQQTPTDVHIEKSVREGGVRPGDQRH